MLKRHTKREGKHCSNTPVLLRVCLLVSQLACVLLSTLLSSASCWMRQGKRATKQMTKKKKNDGMTPVSSPLSQVCLSCQHPPPPPPLSLTPSMQLQSAIRLHIWLAATHTLQGQVVKGRVKGTYSPPVQHLSANALKTSDSTLRDPKIRYRGGQSDNFRSWSILKASATYFSGELSRLQYLISSYLFFQTLHNLIDSVLHDQINRLM